MSNTLMTGTHTLLAGPENAMVLPTAQPVVLRITDLTVKYGDRETVRGVTLDLRAGETVALVGGSGAGKSTIAKAVAGLVRPASGSIAIDLSADGSGAFLDLATAKRRATREARRAVHLVLQDPYASLPPHRRVIDIVAEPLVIHRMGDRDSRVAIASDALRSLGLDPQRYQSRFPHELSGGERQRVAFSRAIVTRPAVILADEPTGMLDATLRAEVAALMGDLARQQGTAVLHITHDLALAARTCDRVIVMSDGAVVEQGITTEVLHDPQHPVTQQLLAAALRGTRRVHAT